MNYRDIKSIISNNVSLFVRTSLRIPFRLHVRYSRVISPTALTYVFIHGLADTGEIWTAIIKELPENVNFIVVDLLGHGKSRHFKASVYSADYQARNVIATSIGLGCIGPHIFVGHSFGSIVAVECARRNPLTKKLILCSLPLYDKAKDGKLNPKNPESVLFKIYRHGLKHPKSTVAMYNIIGKLGLGGPSKTSLSKETFLSFEETLKAGIINQKTGPHLSSLKIPVSIVYGRLDPLIISKNISKIAKNRPNIKAKVVLSDHAMRPALIKAVLAEINDSIKPISK